MMFKRRKLKLNVDVSKVKVSCTGKINAKPNNYSWKNNRIPSDQKRDGGSDQVQVHRDGSIKAREHRGKGEGETSEFQTRNRCFGVFGDKGKSYTKMHYPSNLIICIRNQDVECSTVILIQTIEISHTRDEYGVSRWDESNKNIYKKFDLGETVRRADY